MPCVLKKIGTDLWSAPAGSAVTVTVKAQNTKLTNARYNGNELTVLTDSTATFTTASGWEPLVLILTPVIEDLAVDEVATDGSTQTLYSYIGDSEDDISFWVKGI